MYSSSSSSSSRCYANSGYDVMTGNNMIYICFIVGKGHLYDSQSEDSDCPGMRL